MMRSILQIAREHACRSMTVMCKMTSFDKGLKSSVITTRNKFSELKKEYHQGLLKPRTDETNVDKHEPEDLNNSPSVEKYMICAEKYMVSK